MHAVFSNDIASDCVACAEFVDLDLETTPNEFKEEKQLSASLRKYYNLCKRKSFAAYVSSKKNKKGPTSWCCCGQTFTEHFAVHKHVAQSHQTEIQQTTQCAFERVTKVKEEQLNEQELKLPSKMDVSLWIPDTAHISEEQLKKGPGKVLLYYRYCPVADPHTVCAWQEVLCEKLHLSGKVRVATEGINGTVGGTSVATDIYIDAMCSHPLFRMEKEEFKTSHGGAECFTALKVGVYKEIVPMGVDPDVVSYHLAGTHLEPEEFHKEVEAFLSKGDWNSDTILLDCRNFYESKIVRSE